MKRRSIKQSHTKRRTGRSYADKIRLKLNGHSRDPRWMWWTSAESTPLHDGRECTAYLGELRAEWPQ